MTYPKRLIEVDLPIKRISAHARREKSIRHGHISTLHIWWARRPLAACRAVICAALWPDPADPDCPVAFKVVAEKLMREWTDHEHQELLSPESRPHFEKIRQHPVHPVNPVQLRTLLLDFIADFANWDNSTVREYLETSRALTAYAHRSLTEPGFNPTAAEIEQSIRNPQSTIRNWPKPLVVDPFCGGGSIPLEALRVGADAFASDLNPIPVLLNKVVLEYIPKYGQRLADEVRKWGNWIKHEAEKELAEFYPKDPDGATPIAYLWARTIQCEGPGCGAEVPLIRSLWLAKKSNRSVAMQIVPRPRAKRVDFQLIVKQRGGWVDQDDLKTKIEDPKFDGTVKRGSATCPCCGYTTPVARIRDQLRAKKGGANNARLMCVVSSRSDEQGRFYRLPSNSDIKAVNGAAAELVRRKKAHRGELSLVPEEPLPPQGTLGFRVQLYGMLEWGHLFTSRQLLTLTTLARVVRAVGAQLHAGKKDQAFAEAVQASLACCVDRCVNQLSSLSKWHNGREVVDGVFARQALPMLWDFADIQPFGENAFWNGAVGWVVSVMERQAPSHTGTVEPASAAAHPLPDDSAMAFVTDPPYYDAVPYADLSDFFYVWLKRMLPDSLSGPFASQLSPKVEECIVDEVKGKDRAYFEKMMKKAMVEGRRVLSPDGVGVVVFAHKSTGGWEAQLQAMVDAGWVMTGSWPIDTELGNRLRAMDSAALASSVHLVCRPRENPDGSVRTEEVGDWRDVLAELPRRIHDWMPRLADEGVVGADAIFACLGPALEIFSRYSRVEKASGDAVTLKEYLEQVWAAVAKEALTMIFSGADATGFEEDARLTAMWLWTLKTDDQRSEVGGQESEEESGDEEGNSKKGGAGGFVLEYDAARKIAQGLGAHLEDLCSLVEVSGETARLLPVAERAGHLFGKSEGKAASVRRRREPQMDLFKALQADDDKQASFGDTKVESVGKTVLDRVHQSMILFAASRGEALKRFLVEDGAGNDQRFWRLAQALSALYPISTDEKRWVDGVLARKKGLGF